MATHRYPIQLDLRISNVVRDIHQVQERLVRDGVVAIHAKLADVHAVEPYRLQGRVRQLRDTAEVELDEQRAGLDEVDDRGVGLAVAAEQLELYCQPIFSGRSDQERP